MARPTPGPDLKCLHFCVPDQNRRCIPITFGLYKRFMTSNTKRHVLVFPGALLLLSLTGCASFTELGPTSNWPYNTRSNKSISVVVSNQITMELGGQPEGRVESVTLHPKIEKNAIRAYVESGLFSDVKSGLGEADLRSETHVRSHVQVGHLYLRLLFFFTAGIVPYKSTYDLTVSTSLKDATGSQIGTFERSGVVTVWYGLAFIFFTPFHESPLEAPIYDLNCQIIVDAHKQGIF